MFHKGVCSLLGGTADANYLLYCTAATGATTVGGSAVCTTCRTTASGSKLKFVVISNTCTACPDNATACTTLTTGVVCTTGYVLNFAGSACLSCGGILTSKCASPATDQVTTAAICTATGATAGNACASGDTDKCADGYFVTAADPAASPKVGATCTACAANCKTCSSNTVCTVCFNGFHFASATSCTVCTDKSSSCSTNVCAAPYY